MIWILHCWTHEGPFIYSLLVTNCSHLVHTLNAERRTGNGVHQQPTTDPSILSLLALCERHGRAWRAAASSVGGISRH